MLVVLSPAKTLDYDTPAHIETSTQPDFVTQSSALIDILRTMSPSRIASLMRISDPLAALNVDRYATWSPTFTKRNAKQAVLAFNGDVYEGLDANSLTAAQLKWAQSHVRILSGLYGLLRPLDLMQPYRLEMGTKLANDAGKDLYAFWGDSITEALNRQLAKTKSRVLVNLASEEYFKSVRPKVLRTPIVTPTFLDWKNGQYKIISFYAKRARGLMARYAITNGITEANDLQRFDTDGYAFDAASSNAQQWIFKRRVAD